MFFFSPALNFVKALEGETSSFTFWRFAGVWHSCGEDMVKGGQSNALKRRLEVAPKANQYIYVKGAPPKVAMQLPQETLVHNLVVH